MNKTVSITILAVITVILTATVLVPIIDDASTEPATSENRYTFKMSELAQGDTLELSYDSTNYALINGVHPDVSSTSGVVQTELYVISDFAVIVAFGNYWYYYFVDSAGVYHAFNVHNSALAATVASFEDGVMSITHNGTTYTNSYTFVYYPDADGDFAYTRVTNSPMINKSAEVVTFNGGANTNGVNYGTMDALTVSYRAESGALVTDYTPTFTTAEAEVEKSVVYSVVESDPEKMIIPLDYTYLVDADDSISNLLHVIPLMVLVALLGAVVAFAMRRE